MADAPFTAFERAQRLAAAAIARLPPRLQVGLSGRPPVRVDGQTLDPQVQLILSVRRALKAPPLCAPTPEAARARFRREMILFRGPQTEVGSVSEFDVPGGGGAPLRVRHYAPPGASPDLLVYLHGGGFVVGDLDTHDEPCRLVCRHARAHVLAVAYRLAPEHPFPAGLEDARAALRWAQANARSLGADPARVSVGGDSAGGNLAAVASRLAAREGSPPSAQLLVYPATDAAARYPSKSLFADGFFLSDEDCETAYGHYADGAGAGRDDPRVSPLRAEDLRGLAPALVVTAGFDVLRDEGEAYAEALRAAGVPVRLRRFPSLAHGFINMTGVSPAARRATAETARDFRALLNDLEARAL